MGKFINEVDATGGLKQDRVVTVPVTVPYADLYDLQSVIESADASITANVKRVTSSSETADVIITQVGTGISESTVVRLLDRSGIKYSVGKIKVRKAGDAGSDDES